MANPYSGKSLYARFGETVLSGRYKSFTEADEIALVDHSGHDACQKEWVVGPAEGALTLEILQEADGTAIWEAVEPGTEGVLIWAPEGYTSGPVYTIDAIVKSRKRSVISDDVVKIVLDFAYTEPETEVSSNRAGALGVRLDAVTLSAAGEVTGIGYLMGAAAITLAGLTLASAGTAAIDGDAAITLAGVTLAAAGTVTTPTPQYARPDSDVTQSNWSGGFGTIDEATYSDADYITGASNGNGTAEYGLSNVTDPTSSSGHTVRFRAWQQNKTKVRTLTAHLIQGTTVISSYPSTITLVKGTQTAYDWTLSAAEADAITDYTDLRIRFVSGGDVGTPNAQRSAVYVSWAELEVPGA